MRTKVCLALLGLFVLVILLQRQQPLPVAALQPPENTSALGKAQSLQGKRPRARANTRMPAPRTAPDLLGHVSSIIAGRDEAVDLEELERTASNIADGDLPAVLNELLAANADARGAELRVLLLRRWAAADPAAAAAWAGTLTIEPLRHESIIHVATAWAEADLSLALQWAQQLSEGVTRESALLG